MGIINEKDKKDVPEKTVSNPLNIGSYEYRATTSKLMKSNGKLII